jgi:hypothetical protein
VRTRVESALHHVHLSELAAAGIVEYDDEQTVIPVAVDQFTAYLDAVPGSA